MDAPASTAAYPSLSDLVLDLESIARTKATSLEFSHLESAAALLALPRYLRAGSRDQQIRLLHADLVKTIDQLTPGYQRTHGQLLFRLGLRGKRDLFAGDDPRLLGNREAALGRRFRQHERTISRDRLVLLREIAYRLTRLADQFGPAHSAGYAVHLLHWSAFAGKKVTSVRYGLHLIVELTNPRVDLLTVLCDYYIAGMRPVEIHAAVPHANRFRQLRSLPVFDVGRKPEDRIAIDADQLQLIRGGRAVTVVEFLSPPPVGTPIELHAWGEGRILRRKPPPVLIAPTIQPGPARLVLSTWMPDGRKRGHRVVKVDTEGREHEVTDLMLKNAHGWVYAVIDRPEPDVTYRFDWRCPRRA